MVVVVGAKWLGHGCRIGLCLYSWELTDWISDSFIKVRWEVNQGIIGCDANYFSSINCSMDCDIDILSLVFRRNELENLKIVLGA